MARQAERSAATIKAILGAARALFGQDGYDAVTIDMIVEKAGCRKGAFYHHFTSKRSVFEQVLDGLQTQLAAELAAPAAEAFAANSAPLMARCIRLYLEGANGADFRRILLVDGPVVLGWKRWREIDDRHFAGMVRGGIVLLLGDEAAQETVEAATRLTLGAIMESALACSAAPDPTAAAADFGSPFELMLAGFAMSGQQ